MQNEFKKYCELIKYDKGNVKLNDKVLKIVEIYENKSKSIS
jgi:hypothetical protein